MRSIFFNNIKDYNDTRFTDYIPDAARKDCREAWKFAKEIGFGMNFHILVQIPEIITELGQPAFQRMIANKLRVHADDNGFEAYQLMVRSCEPGTKDKARLDILYHVPVQKIDLFKKTVGNWPFVEAVNAVSYEETVLPNGTIKSIFNDLFGATSPEFVADHPKIPHKASGPILGHRTFYSRNLWGKRRFHVWRAKNNT